MLAYKKASGSHKFEALLDETLAGKRLEEERQYLEHNPGFEMPYGRAWFLRLAIDSEGAKERDKILAMGDFVAGTILEYYERNGIEPNSGDYDSASWAFINVIDYARFRRDIGLEGRAADLAKRAFVAGDAHCDAGGEQREFMAVCTNWAALVSRIVPKPDYSRWLDQFLLENPLPSPLQHPRSAHEFGLNFSRAWGLWDMYDKTGRLDLAKSYAEHFNAGLKPDKNWNGQYEVVGHWVAQFGMFALQPIFGTVRGR